jgi:2-methylcitrate dehydratase
MSTEVSQLAAFVAAASFEDISVEARDQLKIRVLDTLGVAVGALDAEPIVAIEGLTADLGGTPASTLIGGGKTSPERAAFYNSALSRYLDFMDSYLAKGETNHPSDNLGAVLASSESVGGTGRELLTAFAVAYQVHARLSDVAPRAWLRPHDAGRLRRRGGLRQGATPAGGADRQRDRDLRHR